MKKESLNILVVDDEEGIRETLAELLRLEGFAVQTASNGRSGLETYQENAADLIISDVVMPEKDGVEMVRQIKKINPQLKALFMSGYFGSQNISPDILKAINLMGCPMLKKPFKAKDLLACINQLLA